MPGRAWSAKRERQYEHIKESLIEEGRSEEEAEEIAGRTVNKERARAGEAKESSRISIEDISSGRRGGLRSHSGPGGRTFKQLYEEARRRGLQGRSKMTKAQLEEALKRTSAVEGGSVTSCVDMKVGQAYVCPACGVELQVVKACGESDHPNCGPEQCKLMCCDQEMQLESHPCLPPEAHGQVLATGGLL